MAAGVATSSASHAHAHVKWFSPYDLSGPPQQIERVFDYNFDLLCALSILLLVLGCAIESRAPGRALLRGINALTRSIETNSDTLIRGGCGFFLVALWTLGNIILTPELKTDQAWISWFQLAIAACLLWQATLVYAAIGLFTLYAIGMHDYGIFHLLDYPIFIGLALYLFMSGTQKTLFKIRAIDVLRVSVAITLMWASVEKWAYPQWSYPIIADNPKLTMGFPREFYMQAAGLVEFALSFAIILGPLVRRAAAAMLLGIFVSAIGPFGKIDAIGHAPIIAVLAVILGDGASGRALLSVEIKSIWSFCRGTALLTCSFGAFLATFIAAYYLLHTELYPNIEISLCVCTAHAPDKQSAGASRIKQSHELTACRVLRETSGERAHFVATSPAELRPQPTLCEIDPKGGTDAAPD